MLPPRPTKIKRGRLANREKKSLPELAKDIQASLFFPVVAVADLAIAWIRAYFWGTLELRLRFGPPNRGSRGGVVVVVAYHGEEAHLAPFIDYHRRIGASEFVFLDVSPDGSLAGLLDGRTDVAIWRPHAPGRLDHALYWRNYLRWRYGSGRWCLSLEPSERFVFFRCKTRQIRDLVEFLESERREHIYAVVVEMYGDEPAASIGLARGEDPAAKLQYFDAFGYSVAEQGPYENVRVRGGLQRRTLYRANPDNSPALNRIPLVKWRWYFAYAVGRRLMMPWRFNSPHSPHHSTPTACVLRYALIDGDSSLEIASRIEATEFVAGERVTSYAGLHSLRDRTLKHDFSAQFSDSGDLVDAGLLNPGQWF